MADYPDDSEEIEFQQDIDAIDGALAQARAELANINEAASTADHVANDNGEYSLHEVHGIGRYAVVRRTGWRPLLKVIHDPAADIDFSTSNYPAFDGIIAENFQSPYLLDPLNDKYESYRPLRDNIAAVRNFLMESYYVDTPPGMTPEKAAQAMKEISEFVGKGLDNNYRFLGILPNHHLGKPWIDIAQASRPGGAGAQYLYEKILEMHRQSSWMRPFSAVIALFGGTKAPDWMLPPAHKTEFTDIFSHDIAPAAANPGPTAAAITAAVGKVNALESNRQLRIDQHELSNAANDLNLLGEQLLYSASTMQNVAQLSEPVRRDAIDIAKDILRKLKISIGDVNIKDGLNLSPKDDKSAFSSIKGVALIYERMLGWAKGIDPTIMQHPSIVAATQSIGQLGALAKREALRMAKIAGNRQLESEITMQLANVPAAYGTSLETKVSGLLDKVESGINVLMTQVKTISGPNAQIGHSMTNELGSSINSAPTAGLGQQANALGNRASDDAAKRNAQMVTAQAVNQQAQAAKIQSEAKKASTSNDPQQPRQTRNPIGRSLVQSMSGRGIKVNTSSTSTSSTTPNSPNNPANRNTANQANMARLNQLHHEQEEHELHERQRLEMLRIQQQQKAAKTAAKIDPSLIKGFQTATNTKGMGPVVPVKKVVAPTPEAPTITAPKTPGTPVRNSYGIDPKDPNSPVPPTTPQRGGGRGL